MSIRQGSEEKLSLTGGLSKLGEPINSNMRFGVGSITKTAVAATILKLEEEGTLSIHDKISQWIDLTNENIDPDITIAQLLQHFSGVRDYFMNENVWPTVMSNLFQPLEPMEIVNFIGEPVFPRGRRWEYSNSNYILLGLIIESASGQSVGEAMRSRLWDPLQLDHIYFADDESPTGPLAVPWRDGNRDGVLTDITEEYGAGYHSIFWTAADVFSTASDLSAWAYHMLAGDALSQTSRRKMLEFVDLPDPVATGYGLGLRRVVLAGRSMWGHTGGMRGYGAYMFYDQLSGVSIVILNNQSLSTDGPQLRYELVTEILTEVFAAL